MQALRHSWKTIGAAATGAVLAMTPAYAQSANPEVPPCGRVEAPGYEHAASCATPGHETPMTLAEVLAEPGFSRIVVLHFGKGQLDADMVAYDLTVNANTPAIAVPGGPDNAVQLVIAGVTDERLIFNQQGQTRRVGTLAPPLYQQRIAAMNEAASRASGAQVVRTAANNGPTGSN